MNTLLPVTHHAGRADAPDYPLCMSGAQWLWLKGLMSAHHPVVEADQATCYRCINCLAQAVADALRDTP